jgi:hypothetical protein
MQTADVSDRDDRPAGWRLGSPMDGSLLSSERCVPLVIVGELARRWPRARPVVFWAGHGASAVTQDGSDWEPTLDLSNITWLRDARQIMEEFIGQAPGSFPLAVLASRAPQE